MYVHLEHEHALHFWRAGPRSPHILRLPVSQSIWTSIKNNALNLQAEMQARAGVNPIARRPPTLVYACVCLKYETETNMPRLMCDSKS